MGFNDLILKQMVPLSAALTGPQKELFLSIPEIAWMYKYVVKSHTQVTQVVDVAATDLLIADLTRLIEGADMRHDRMIRAFYYAMTASIEYLRGLPEPLTADADNLEQVRDQLLPAGLSWVNVTFLEEAGNAATLKDILTPKLEETLRNVPLVGGTVLDAARHWSEEGMKLGDLERQRINLEQSGKEAPNARAARSYWLTQIGDLITNLKKVEGRNEEVALLLNPLLAAAKHVAKSPKKAPVESASGGSA